MTKRQKRKKAYEYIKNIISNNLTKRQRVMIGRLTMDKVKIIQNEHKKSLLSAQRKVVK